MKHAAFSNAFNADFDEGKHKRDDSGRFSKSGGVVMEINVPKGTKTINLSGESDVNSNEEVILGRGTSVKVTSVTKKGGETHVKVDVVKSEAPSKQTSTPSKEKRLPQDLPLSRWERYIVSR